MRNYNVTPEFKTQVSAVLATKKFTTVFPYMNLINREGFTYTETELNSVVQFLGEFSYNEVAEFFQQLPTYCTEVDSTPESQDEVQPESKAAPVVEMTVEK
jgi:hypothetical protein